MQTPVPVLIVIACNFPRASLFKKSNLGLQTPYHQLCRITTTTMSSMRNAVQRRSHRERGQLKEREKLGLLEKSKACFGTHSRPLAVSSDPRLGLQTPSSRSQEETDRTQEPEK